LSDTAGDDQVDSGSKTVEHEHEVAVADSLSERIRQVSHALERLDEGSYGFCERCGKPIPAARLAAFPSATLDVGCKQLEERR
jgi:DnaK suppressor protein